MAHIRSRKHPATQQPLRHRGAALALVVMALPPSLRAQPTQAPETGETTLPEIPGDKICLFGLTQLLDDGFIAFSSSPLICDDQLPSPHFSVPPKSSNTQQPWPIFTGEDLSTRH